MYNIIGQALFISAVLSFTLSGMALLVSRRSLTRSVFLAGFYADVLDFFYLPLRQIFLKFSDTRILDK
ncbi:MAG TPA: polyprenyl synthetase, partial [Methanosarcina sp.]|nr:polyprenyl synthetase [Methanosarcina sp.]